MPALMADLRGHIDPVGGVAGDMLAAALVEALPELEGAMRADVAAVAPDDLVVLVIERRPTGALMGTRFEVFPRPSAASLPAGYPEFRSRIAAAALHPAVRDLALSILEHLAKAEAAVHGVSLDEVHFHEIADWDTLVDAIAVASLAVRAGVSSWTVGSLPRGGGLVSTAHGLLPVPAPATQRLLSGFAWHDDGIGGERVTPTGAAILRALVVDPSARAPAGRLAGHGYGVGRRTMGNLPNVVRVSLYAADEAARDGRVAVISFEVDDMTGEELAVAAERLRAECGVFDLSLVSLAGKKGRPATGFRLLVDPAAADGIGQLCLDETSTLGLRIREERRLILSRSSRQVQAEGSPWPVKSAVRPDGTTTAKVESDALHHVPSLAERRRLARLLEREPEKGTGR
jgi:uncharacterized protein (TIGR00299 family) protein